MQIPPELVEAKRVVELGILALPGVVGISLGMREHDGELADELAVRILVENLDNVPPGLPGEIGGVAVSIVESSVRPCAFTPDTARYRNLRGGIKIVQPNVGAGTLGVLVEDASTGEILGLTCQHVVGNSGQNFPLTVWQPQNPPLPHGSTPPADDSLGLVIRSDFPQTPPLPFSPVRCGMVDAAVFRLDGAVAAGRQLSRGVAKLGVASPNLIDAVTGTAAPAVDPTAGLHRVRKRGFVTGTTMGTVIAQHATLKWEPKGVTVDCFLFDQWEINGDADIFALDGDSGALVLQESSPVALGLLWGNNRATRFIREGKRGYVTAISTVEAYLGVSVVWA